MTPTGEEDKRTLIELSDVPFGSIYAAAYRQCLVGPPTNMCDIIICFTIVKCGFSFTSALGARQTFAIDSNVLTMVLNMSG